MTGGVMMGMRLLGPVYLIGGQDYHSVYLDWPANDCNVYLVDTGDTLVMVDCGCGESLEAILNNVKEMGLELKDVSHVLLTHEHFPHAGAAEALQKMKIEVVCSPGAAEAITSGDMRTAAYHYHKEFAPCEKVTEVSDGDSISVGDCQFTVVALPGHSQGSVGYELHSERGRMLFCGDVVRSPGLESFRNRLDYDPELYLESLTKLLEDPPDMLYPGHGLFCLSYGRVWIEEELEKLLASMAAGRRGETARHDV